MLRKIESPAKCELRSVIRFLHAEGSNAAEIHRRMSKVYGETFMSDSKVRKWCRNFDAGRTDVHDAGGQGRKPMSTDDLVQRVDQVIRGNRRFTISGLSDLFREISRSALYTIVSTTWHNHHCSFVQQDSSTASKGNSEQEKRNVVVRHCPSS
ncbi:hypothetical protein AVEN_225417-1 [Araneus ventricosus]|uniref:Mos1 transposase HTH domain-containing protein n=1 Tax=Araneus ventricosus TaxID=182803 RepID=A0A4Y2RR29_ARAVE|nr:hypothetical protein AVEN_225417-1 [Araneus ventricosus]